MKPPITWPMFLAQSQAGRTLDLPCNDGTRWLRARRDGEVVRCELWRSSTHVTWYRAPDETEARVVLDALLLAPAPRRPPALDELDAAFAFVRTELAMRRSVALFLEDVLSVRYTRTDGAWCALRWHERDGRLAVDVRGAHGRINVTMAQLRWDARLGINRPIAPRKQWFASMADALQHDTIAAVGAWMP